MGTLRNRVVCGLVVLLGLGEAVALHAKLPKPPQRPLPAGGEITVLALGDSITKGVRGGVTAEETFCHRLEGTLRESGWPVRVVNAGLGGERAGQGLGRLTRELKTHLPDFVLIMYGTNDSYVDPGAQAPRVAEADFEHHLRQLVRRVRESGAEPILMTEPTFAKAAAPNGLGEHGNVRLSSYMERVRRLSRELACPLIDHFAGWLAAEEGGTNLSGWTTDGYHPNPAGHRDLAERIAPLLQERRSSLWALPWSEWRRRPADYQPWPELRAKIGETEVNASRQPGAVYFVVPWEAARGTLLQLPRLDNVVRRAWWATPANEAIAGTVRELATAETGSNDLPEPFVPAPDRILKFTQSATTWSIALPSLPEALPGMAPLLVVLDVEGVPTLAPDAGAVARPGRDGVISFPAHHARTFGEKLQFEPLPHKNTVGYWVNPQDFATWRFEGATPGTYRVAVFQGCGAGQGGSTVSIGVRPGTSPDTETKGPDNAASGEPDSARVSFAFEETGHFQNFRWRDVGTIELASAGPHQLELRCEKLAKNAVGDVRQIRLIPNSPPSAGPREVQDVAPDAWLPPLSTAAPAPGARLLKKAPGFEKTTAYHTLYVPTDWAAGQKHKYPVIVEWTGNGGYVDDRGDRCTGRPEDGSLGYGLAGSDGALCLSLPYLDATGQHAVRTWWGTAPEHRPDTTVRYALAAVREACEQFGGDPERVVLVGFSRGSLACNALGLHDDEIAGLWKGMICFSHYDGVRSWPYAGADPASAKARLARLKGRPQLILAEQPGDKSPLLEATEAYLVGTGLPTERTLRSTGYLNHSDAWGLRPGETRDFAREWIRKLVAK